MKIFNLIKLIVVLVLTSLLTKADGQVTASFYFNANNSKFAVGYEFTDRFWADLRIYSGSLMEDITPELVLAYNFLQKDKYETYAGLGLSIQHFEGVVIPIGLAVKPFESLENLSFNIEFTPLIGDHGMLLRSYLGVRYEIGK